MDTKKKNLYDAYTAILKEELVPAMGCTEPIAIAYAAAVARETLGMLSGYCKNQRQRKYYQKCKKRCRTQYRGDSAALRRLREQGL